MWTFADDGWSDVTLFLKKSEGELPGPEERLGAAAEQAPDQRRRGGDAEDDEEAPRAGEPAERGAACEMHGLDKGSNRAICRKSTSSRKRVVCAELKKSRL